MIAAFDLPMVGGGLAAAVPASRLSVSVLTVGSTVRSRRTWLAQPDHRRVPSPLRVALRTSSRNATEDAQRNVANPDRLKPAASAVPPRGPDAHESRDLQLWRW